jgi:hypothetical protein
MDQETEIRVLRQVLEIVRQYPDFDEGGPIPEMFDEALEGKIPEVIRLCSLFQ